MSNPIVEAAQRARAKYGKELVGIVALEDAAYEALKPIREAIENIPNGLDAVDLYDELLAIYKLAGGHCE